MRSIKIKLFLSFVGVSLLVFIGGLINVTFAVISLGLSIFFGYLISSDLRNSLINLRNIAAQMAKGNLDIRTKKISDDEMGEIALSLNETGERLKTFFENIQGEKARSDVIFESIGEGMVVVDEKGILRFMNHRAKMMIGLFENILGKRFVDLIAIKDAKGAIVETSKRPLVRTLTTQQKIVTSSNYENIYYYVRPDGIEVPVVITCTPLFFKGKLAGAIALFRDVTKERDVDRMKTEFISLASHQLRTPLSAIKWFSEMLIAGDAGELNPEQKEFVQNISGSTDRMVELVNSLLNISRIESGRIIVDPQPTNLKELVESIVLELRPKIDEKNHNLIISVHEDLPIINVDPKLIRQVYLNLLTNAIKYTPKGGEITVMISKREDQIISQVSDNGYGIPEKDKAKVFTKFFRGENVIKVETDGTGLGLYLIKAIVESSKGRIWFQSLEGKGTTFWFSLPISGMKPKKGEVTLDN